MPRPYRPEFRARAIALVCESRQVTQIAEDLGIHAVTLHNLLRQDDVDHRRRPGLSSKVPAELRTARGRVRQVEQEIAILRRAATWLDEDGRVSPKGAHPVSDRLVGTGAPPAPAAACWGFRQGHYRHWKRSTSAPNCADAGSPA